MKKFWLDRMLCVCCSIRRAILSQGTEAVMSYLRNRIPAGTIAAGSIWNDWCTFDWFHNCFHICVVKKDVRTCTPSDGEGMNHEFWSKPTLKCEGFRSLMLCRWHWYCFAYPRWYIIFYHRWRATWVCMKCWCACDTINPVSHLHVWLIVMDVEKPQMQQWADESCYHKKRCVTKKKASSRRRT